LGAGAALPGKGKKCDEKIPKIFSSYKNSTMENTDKGISDIHLAKDARNLQSYIALV
jgi:hypothetical protein